MNQADHWALQFGLRRNPFQDNIDTDLFFRTRQHEEALLKIAMGLRDKHALILLAGVSGTGKTLVSQAALREMDGLLYKPVLILAHPGMSRAGLLSAIVQELELKPGRFSAQRLRAVQDKALRLYAEGRRLVIIIDEAHFLKADALHLLRTLSNLETEKEKLVTVLLCAELALLRRLRAPSYAALRGRITFVITLSPLSAVDLEQYVKYRLLKCGAEPDLLPPEVYPLALEKSGGIPRQVNRLFYCAFIEAMAADAPLDLSRLETAAVTLAGLGD